MKQKKILFGITGLTLGGAERVLVDLVNQLSKSQEVTIFTIYAKGELEKQLSKDVKRKSLYPFSFQEISKWKRKWISLKLLFQKKKYYQQTIKGEYDLEISFLEGPITRLFSVKNKKVKKIAWIHNDISLVFGQGIVAKMKKWLDRKTYQKYDTLIFVSEDNKRKFEGIYSDLRNAELMPIPKRVIYNYIDKENVIEQAKEEIMEVNKDNLNFVTVARLVEQKGIDRLIEIHKKLIKEGLSHNFYVIGEGPLKEKLKTQIREENVEQTFILLGKKENPYPYIKIADYFCLLSYFEGYGMVIEEAKILGKHIIITDTAAREAVVGYDKAIIAENTKEGIYDNLKTLIQKGKVDQENVEQYDNQKILDKVRKVIGE